MITTMAIKSGLMKVTPFLRAKLEPVIAPAIMEGILIKAYCHTMAPLIPKNINAPMQAAQLITLALPAALMKSQPK